MGSSVAPPAQRARTKTPDFSDLFRSGNGSRHSSRTGAATGTSPSSSPFPGEKSTLTKASSRRSMLPFLGRKKPAEPPAVPPVPISRKSIGHPIAPVNTVRRSFGNGHTVLMITPSSTSLPVEHPPLPSKLPPMDAHAPSFGSKLAAHFTPLRSPSRTGRSRQSIIPAPAAVPIPPVPSPTSLSPPVFEVREPSIESYHTVQSRSTTPRPLRGPHVSAVGNGDEEDFSDLFTLPNQFKKPPQSPLTPSGTSVHIYLGDSPRKSDELLTPTTPITPTGPPLHFPIPPSTIVPPRSILADKSHPRYSSELASLSSQGSRSPSKRPSPVRVDSARTVYSDFSSQDGRSRGSHYRTTSISGSDTDTSRANDPTRGFKLVPAAPKASSMKSKILTPNVTKASSSGPPPSFPLPTPPLSPNPLVPRSAPIASPNRVAFPRPRANTLSVTSNLAVPCQALPKANPSPPLRSLRANSDAAPEATLEELREALAQQRRKNTQLQEYIVTITKRYEDDRIAMTKNIEKLERNVRKKMREIEGLRWLVIHNGAVSDIDAAANLARSSLSTQDGDVPDGERGPSSSSSQMVAPHPSAPFHQSTSGPRGASITVTGATTAPLSSGSMASLLSASSTSETAPSLTLIPERIDGISRAERQRLKEERRASKALRRISAASALALATDSLPRSSSADSPVAPNFDPKQSMDEVLERLQPFRHS